jgi:hypothetical protein
MIYQSSWLLLVFIADHEAELSYLTLGSGSSPGAQWSLFQ